MQSRLLSCRFKRSINNVFLFSVGFTQQPFDTISVMGTLENTLAHTEHGLRGKVTRHLRDSINQNDGRCFYRLTLLMQRFNEFAP